MGRWRTKELFRQVDQADQSFALLADENRITSARSRPARRTRFSTGERVRSGAERCRPTVS